MVVYVYSNSGAHYMQEEYPRIPVCGDYLEVDGNIYKVWRVFLIDANSAKVQLSTKITMSGLQNRMFYE